MKHSLALILLATASLTACNSGGSSTNNSASTVGATTPITQNPSNESSGEQSNTPATPSVTPESQFNPIKNATISSNNNQETSTQNYTLPDSCYETERGELPYKSDSHMVLQGMCKTEDGTLRKYSMDSSFIISKLNVDMCAPDSQILNVDGHLTCSKYRDDIPKGAYMKNCQIDNFESSSIRGRLYAECYGLEGTKISSTLDYYSQCSQGDIVSIDPTTLKIRCNNPFKTRENYSYLTNNSCTAVNDLEPLGTHYAVATCKNNRGIMASGTTNLDLNLCTNGSDVYNRNGMLICAQYRNDIPKGSYLNTCHVNYFDANTLNGKLGVSCEDQSGSLTTSELDYFAKCAQNSTVSLSASNTIQCDSYNRMTNNN